MTTLPHHPALPAPSAYAAHVDAVLGRSRRLRPPEPKLPPVAGWIIGCALLVLILTFILP